MKQKLPLTVFIGGTRGIGGTAARMLASRGYEVLAVGRRAVPTSYTGENLKNIKGDLLKRNALIETIRKEIGRRKIDGLVFFQRFRGGNDIWRNELEMSLTATNEIIESLAPFLNKNSSIVIAGSSASQFIAEEQPPGYHVAKAGIAHLVRYYAATFGRRSVRVNCLSFPAVLKEESKEFYLKNKKLHNLYRKITPLGRMGSAEEIGEIVEFLLSPRASFITGQNIFADGGISLLWQESLARKVSGIGGRIVVRSKISSKMKTRGRKS